MSRIVHLSLKVDDIEKTGDFYQKMFNFRDAETKKTRDHTSRHMTDGEIDFTLLSYDEGATSAESSAAGAGPCIHHFGIEVEDLEQSTREIQANGCVVISDPGVIPVKFRAPGGTIAELVEIGRYKTDNGGQKINRITHISLKVEDIRSVGDFYIRQFGFRDTETKKTRDHTSRHMTDGQIDFTLIAYDPGTTSAESTASGEGPCIHHFAVEVEDLEKSTRDIQGFGCEIISDAGVIPVKFRDPGGTVAELVEIGRYAQLGMA
ncbi:MAG: Glyoxalase/Bleomycin resistance protein/Dioxygenase superfamily protein [Polaromonas sp.]|nr:Glyoxalase/Bleomycin resistance protein/Dioxygenase superfamily protein [Polaromonas sp.]